MRMMEESAARNHRARFGVTHGMSDTKSFGETLSRSGKELVLSWFLRSPCYLQGRQEPA